ncbi:DUF2179 domain-containing protein [Aerococcus sp. UMB7834]|uniref:DUF2179 domain-containing protein n=1 Tax=Aerococcus sp. UMB7834 TaxID=3046342 RepID=UPI002550054D|nr:DUF2179 domain-containing protein [Aerococcus sp. UMB7834]MDK6804805.1 DUF2179 domain-containing protein [Aerococcus sp. UMB7834]
MDYHLLLKIFSINLIYIMLNTMRLLLSMRGYRLPASCLAVVEITIYAIGLSMVMQYLDQPAYLLAYALGFGVGIYCGMLLEDKIALGYAVIQIFIASDNHALAEELRNRGYGVTVQSGYGRDGDRLILTILTPRSTERKLCRTIEEIDDRAFYISYDAKYIHGGFWTKRVTKLRVQRAHEALEDQEPLDPRTERVSEDEFVNDEINKL